MLVALDIAVKLLLLIVTQWLYGFCWAGCYMHVDWLQLYHVITSCEIAIQVHMYDHIASSTLSQ